MIWSINVGDVFIRHARFIWLNFIEYTFVSLLVARKIENKNEGHEKVSVIISI